VSCVVGPYTGHGLCHVWLVLTLDTDCVSVVGPYTGHGLCHVWLVLTLDTEFVKVLGKN
jgi:ABC-type arginine transport system permease subunit